MKKLQNKVNVSPVDAVNLYGAIKDDTGSNNGTPVDTELMNDAAVFFERLMVKAAVTANGLPDNETNGWQLYEAFRKITKPYKAYAGTIGQTGTAAPSVGVVGYNEVGSIVWSRTGVGTYKGTLVGAFTSGKTLCFITQSGLGGSTTPAIFQLARNNSDEVLLYTYDHTGTLADGLLTFIGGCSLEIRVYD